MYLGELFRFKELEKEEESFWEFSEENFSSLYDYLLFIKDNWHEILSSSIPPLNLRKLAFILKIYNLHGMLEELYFKHKDVNVWVYYLSILNYQCEFSKIETIKLDYENSPLLTDSPILYFDFLIANVEYKFLCNNIHGIPEIISEIEKVVSQIEKTYSRATSFYFRALLLFFKGKTKVYMGEFLEAKSLFMQALRYLGKRKINDNYLLGSLYHFLSSIHIYIDLDLAEFYAQKSLDFYGKLGLKIKQKDVLIFYSYIRFHKGYVDDSLNSLIELSSYFEHNFNPRNLLDVYSFLGAIFLELNQFENAEFYIIRILDLMFEYSYETPLQYEIILDYYLAVKNIDIASKYLIQLQQILEKNKVKEKSIFFLIYKICKGNLDLLKQNMWEAESGLQDLMANEYFSHYTYYLLKRNYALAEILLINLKILDEKDSAFSKLTVILKEYAEMQKRYFSLFYLIRYFTLLSRFYLLLNANEKVETTFDRLKNLLSKFNLSDSTLQQIFTNYEINLIEKFNSKAVQLLYLTSSFDFSSNLSIAESDLTEIINSFTSKKKNYILLQVINSITNDIIYTYSFKPNHNSFSEEHFANLISAILDIYKTANIQDNSVNGDCKYIANSRFFVTIFPFENYLFSLVSDYYTHDGKKRLVHFAYDTIDHVKTKEDSSFLKNKVQEYF